MDGFFSVSQARSFKPKPLAIARCDECGLHTAGCESPKMHRAGQGKRNVLVVSEYPTAAADRQGDPLQDGGGRYLDAAMAEFGWDMRRDCALTYAARCAPPGGNLKGRKISPVESCRPFVLADIAEVKPTLIILLGWYAVRGVVGHVWGKEDVGAMGRWAGTRIPAHKPNAWICPLNHPADLMAAASKGDKFLESEFRRHLHAALKLADSAPWPDGPPDYKAMVEPIMSPDAAAARLRRYTSGNIAFDYETNCLKPDHADGEIVCASVCWEGQETIAFPWHGAVIPEMKRLLADPNVGKIMQNCFVGETKFLTREFGSVSLQSMAGRRVTVLNHEGRWVKASVRSFGRQPVCDVTFARRNHLKTVRCTPDHQWVIAEDGSRRATHELRPRRWDGRDSTVPDGVPILCAPKEVSNPEEYLAGIRHGIICGDGSNHIRRPGNYSVRLCQDKAEYLRYFDGYRTTYPRTHKGDPNVYFKDFSIDLKAPPPSGVSDSYLIGFVRGMIGTDGSVTQDGHVSLTGERGLMQWCRDNFCRVGYVFQKDFISPPSGYTRQGFKRNQESLRLLFTRVCITPDDLIRTKHRARFRMANTGPYRFSSRTNVLGGEEVFCAEVPDGHSFTLDGGMVTGNCTMEVRWTKAKLGIDVANVVFDTMLGAHAINPRERMKERGGGVTGLKFLAFARLGCPEYASHLDGLLGSTDKEKGSRGGYARNRVWEIDMRQLLQYCGADSLLEYELAMILSRELGVQL